MKYYAITSGDPMGIGLEVTAKALYELGPQKACRFVVYRSQKSELKQLQKIDKKFKRITVPTLLHGLALTEKDSRVLIDINHPAPAPFWVEEAAKACSNHSLKGLITAPLSKTLIHKCGFKAKGHTEILQQVSNTKKVHMVFVGPSFSVLLATAHMPLSKVPRALTQKELELAVERALNLRKILSARVRKRPVALLGLNPHAGEGGLLGSEEKSFFHTVVKSFKGVVGPLSPDAAFLKQNWDSYSVYVACYHDQGLIPFKLVHGAESGYHLTFGLPFIRTSVDHGTAFDIYGKNKANASSMRDAIKACLKLSE